MKHQNTIELLKLKMNGLIYEIKEADARYRCWYHKGCYQLAWVYKEKLDMLFKELADVNITLLMEKTREQLDRISTCAVLAEIGILCSETNGAIYI